jgi:hypothetical protein
MEKHRSTSKRGRVIENPTHARQRHPETHFGTRLIIRILRRQAVTDPVAMEDPQSAKRLGESQPPRPASQVAG